MSETIRKPTQTLRPAVAIEPGPLASMLRRVFVRDLVMMCSIGVHAHEHENKQRVRLNLDLDALETAEPIDDDLRNVVCYDEIISAVRRVVDAGHVRLIETLAERIAGLCLADPRIRTARVQIEKLDVYDDVASVGVAIVRHNS
ncbi:diguanylate cyclase [Aliidongia dinghuensis]|uniref:7,8-dihydroneopterin aldolase n=1 Tax=Aliidongia dinghuensis TaxID=1867774 RepID=A0A8J3E6K6_9PROT|nr:dihydroneopterin aldolase [Aliidongia dinghuensis]GGF45481.1 diguanylate cyclase [Aliidongia dinghuensis]